MRNKVIAMVLALLSVVLIFGAGRLSAGSPDAPGGPTSGAAQMFTLEQIYQRLSSGAVGTKMTTFTEPSAAPGTGTMHTLNEIMSLAPAVDNTDGATTANVVAGKKFWGLNATSGQWGPQTGTYIARPAPPCFDNTNRYVDCGNGTVYDSVTGLLWLKNADCFGAGSYSAANATAAGLKSGDCGLSDNSQPGDWRLPTVDEWAATVAQAAVLHCTSLYGNDPSLTNTAGTNCYKFGPQPFNGVISGGYWSSSATESAPTDARYEYLPDSNRYSFSKLGEFHVWPVRGGH